VKIKVLFSKFSRKRFFWTFVHFFRYFTFFKNKVFYDLEGSKEKINESYSLSRVIFKLVCSDFLYALFIFLAFEFVEKKIVFNSIENLNPSFWKDFLIFLNFYRVSLSEHLSSLSAFLTIVASISGIFLGLYFTAISVVASSAFKTVSDNLRRLFLNERVGIYYMKILTLLTVICLLLLGYIILGGVPGILITFFVIFLSVFGIFCFIKLGREAFRFLDPTELSDQIFYDLRKLVTSVTIKSFGWQDSRLQKHYQKIASFSLYAVVDLYRFCTSSRPLKRKSFFNVFKKTIDFLEWYENKKAFIPTKSKWFMLSPRYKSWFLSETSSLEMALNTHTSMRPYFIEEHFWIENETIRILSMAYKNMVKNKRLEVIHESLMPLNKYLSYLGEHFEIGKGKSIIGEITHPIEEYLKKISIEKIITKKDEGKIELALFDAYGLLILSLSLGLLNLISDLKAEHIIEKIENVNWLEIKSIYSMGFPPVLLQPLEEIQKMLSLEKAIEGRIVTPDWYIKELIVIHFLKILENNWKEMLAVLKDFYVDKCSKFLKGEKFVFVALLAGRGLEMYHKINYRLIAFEQLVTSLKATKVGDSLKWPYFDWEGYKDKLEDAYIKLIEISANCLPKLSEIEWEEDVPDLFGEIYHTICKACYDFMLLKKKEHFKLVFTSLFESSLKAPERIRRCLENTQIDEKVALMFEPILDIIELSGYAIIYSELFEIPEFKSICEETWDIYFRESPNAKAWIDNIFKLYQYRKKLFMLFPRDSLRTNWELQLNRELEEQGLVDGLFPPPLISEEKSDIKHSSLLIRVLSRGSRILPIFGADEIFIALYLLKRPEARDIEYRNKDRLLELLELEKEKGV